MVVIAYRLLNIALPRRLKIGLVGSFATLISHQTLGLDKGDGMPDLAMVI